MEKPNNFDIISEKINKLLSEIGDIQNFKNINWEGNIYVYHYEFVNLKFPSCILICSYEDILKKIEQDSVSTIKFFKVYAPMNIKNHLEYLKNKNFLNNSRTSHFDPIITIKKEGVYKSSYGAECPKVSIIKN